nr:hypothetical protein 11 [bacterium]
MTAKQRTFQAEIIERVATETGLYQYQVKKVLEATAHIVVKDLIRGKEVHVLSLGKFWLSRYGARRGFNPRARKSLWLEERLLPKFTWGRRIYGIIKREATKKHGENRDY